MPVAQTHPLIAAFAFAGVALLVGLNNTPAMAAETARGCVVSQPRFQPKAARPASAQATAARPLGGGQLRSLVGEPCPARSGAWNV